MYWFTRDWWLYLLAKRNVGWSHSGRFEWINGWWTTIRCRASGHKCGVVWYNAGGLEPDMTCENCGDYLG